MGENRKYQKKPFCEKKYWKLYRADSGRLFLQTYNKSRTLRECPCAFIPLLAQQEPIAHTSYKGHGNKTGHITTYLLKATPSQLYAASQIRIEIRTPRKKHTEQTDKEYNMLCRHTDIGNLADALIQSIRDDIEEFCNKQPAKKQAESGIITVKKIQPLLETLTVPVKKDAVKDGKGRFHSICILDIGINPSTGCISNTTPNGTYQPENKCSYCYAHQNGPCCIDTIYEFTEKGFINMLKDKITELGLQEKETLYLRLGQNVEANTAPALTRFKGRTSNLKIILNAIAEFSKERQIRTAMPSKILEYDEETVELLKKAHVSVLASIAYKQLETGMMLHGFTPQKRLDGLLQLAENGVASTIYIATDITRGIEQMQDDAKIAVEFYEKHKDILNLQFLDIRITRKKDAKLISGMEWNELIASIQKRLFTDYMGCWRKTGQNHLCAHTTHPDFLRITGDNTGKIRLCSTHVIPEEQRCGKCFTDKL